MHDSTMRCDACWMFNFARRRESHVVTRDIAVDALEPGRNGLDLAIFLVVLSLRLSLLFSGFLQQIKHKKWLSS